jgi:hypothetical protein
LVGVVSARDLVAYFMNEWIHDRNKLQWDDEKNIVREMDALLPPLSLLFSKVDT